MFSSSCLKAAAFAIALLSTSPVLASSSNSSLASELETLIQGLQSIQPAADVQSALQSIQSNAAQINQAAGTVSTRSTNIKAQAACSIFKLLYPGGYVDAGSPAYTNETDVNWSTNCWLPAACFVLPSNTVQVALAMGIVSLTQTKFASRSSGHNPNPDFASIDGSGVLIDLQRLNSRTLINNNQIIQAGPGNHWQDLYSELDSLGLSVIGGRSPQVGIAGLLLGSGLPYIVSQYGFACDNVQNYEVVLGNGSVVNANINQNADLYKALKGGGPNFGIVTRFDLYTRPLHQVWYESLEYSFSDYQAVLNATVQVQNLMENDDKAGFILNAGSGVFLIVKIYAEYSSGPAVFAPFKSITPVGTFAPATNGTIFSLSQTLAVDTASLNHEPVASTSKVDLNVYLNDWSDYLKYSDYSTSGTADMTFSIQPVGKAAVAAGARTGGNILGVQSVEQSFLNALVDWVSPSDAAPAHTAVQNMLSAFDSRSQAAGTFLPYRFQNDASYTQNVLGSYGAANLAALRAASQKYDPLQVMQKLQNGGFLVSKAS